MCCAQRVGFLNRSTRTTIGFTICKYRIDLTSNSQTSMRLSVDWIRDVMFLRWTGQRQMFHAVGVLILSHRFNHSFPLTVWNGWDMHIIITRLILGTSECLTRGSWVSLIRRMSSSRFGSVRSGPNYWRSQTGPGPSVAGRFVRCCTDLLRNSDHSQKLGQSDVASQPMDC